MEEEEEFDGNVVFAVQNVLVFGAHGDGDSEGDVGGGRGE